MVTSMRDFVVFYLNGQRTEVRGAEAGVMLSDYLRYRRSLTGTKVVCAEGDCGACSVLRWFPLPQKRSQPAAFETINSCIVTLAQLDGSSLVTVEGLTAANGGRLTPVQQAMVDCHGSQCGFCTPGFVMALTGLVERRLCEGEPLDVKSAQNYLTGNLCRCTGYAPILEAVNAIDVKRCESLTVTYLTPKIRKDLTEVIKKPVRIALSDSFSFHAPVSVAGANKIRSEFPHTRLLGAGTDLGVLSNKNKIRYEHVMSLHLVPELYDYELVAATKTKPARYRVGARITLAAVRRICAGKIPELARFLDLFASPQIKNVATLVGNIANASPIADSAPAMLALNTTVHIQGPRGKRRVELCDFYRGYRQTCLKKGEWISALEFDIPPPRERFSLKKNSQRKDLDISCVNAAYRMHTEGGEVRSSRLALGGVAATPVRLKKVEAFLEGKALTPEVVSAAVALAHKEITPLSDLRGSQAYRRIVTENLLLGFFSDVVRGAAQ